MRRLPPLNALRAFEASARLGSFVAAAQDVAGLVRRGQPAGTAALEQYLDTRLFQRLARGPQPSPEQGRDYLPELSAGFDLLGESTSRLRARRADGVLTVTTLAAFANGWLLPRLHRFRERAPRIDLVLRTSRQLMDFPPRRHRSRHPLRARCRPWPAGRTADARGVVSGGQSAAVRRRPHAGKTWPRSPTIHCCTTSTPAPSSPGWVGVAGSSARVCPPRRWPVGRSSAIPSC